jgi:poly(ADP-ribose) glycohydrolase
MVNYMVINCVLSSKIRALPVSTFANFGATLKANVSDTKILNKYFFRHVGGGVLGYGCVQEEIKFITCPELIAARLITEVLDDNEALIIKGALPYSKTTGYGSSFKYVAEHDGKICSDTLIVIDALDYSSPNHKETNKQSIDREILKAYAGFSEFPNRVIATGNWGGGAFMVIFEFV